MTWENLVKLARSFIGPRATESIGGTQTLITVRSKDLGPLVRVTESASGFVVYVGPSEHMKVPDYDMLVRLTDALISVTGYLSAQRGDTLSISDTWERSMALQGQYYSSMREHQIPRNPNN